MDDATVRFINHPLQTPSRPALSFVSLPRNLSPLEAWGFGLTGLLLWLSAAPGAQAEMGNQAIFVWLLGTVVGVMVNLQVRRLGMAMPNVAGGTPNYMTRLLSQYPRVATYAAIGYFISWVAVLPANAIVLTDLCQINLAILGIDCPSLVLRIIFTLLAFMVAFSGTRALSILHLYVVLPAVALLLVFCLQGLGWLALSPESPGLLPGDWSGFKLHTWAKWYVISTYAVYACETASTFVADSRYPQRTSNMLSIVAGLIPIVYLGGSWVLMRLATQAELGDNAFLNLLAAASPFWGKTASLLVTLLISAGCLLSCATAVSICPRILYQLAADGLISPLYTVVSRRGVLAPGLMITLGLSLGCLVWGDLTRIVIITGMGWLLSFVALHFGLWLQRDRPEVLFPRWSLGFAIIELGALIIGGIAWDWLDLLIGLAIPVGILVIDNRLQQVSWGLFQMSWWQNRFYTPKSSETKDLIILQVGMIMALVSGAAAIGWLTREQLQSAPANVIGNFFVLLMLLTAFVAVTIACWTSLPQVTSIIEAREQAEQLFITALDAILMLDRHGLILKANPASEPLLAKTHEELEKLPLQTLLPGLGEQPAQWPIRSEQRFIQADGTDRTFEVAIASSSSQDQLLGYTVILRDLTEQKQAEQALRQSEATNRAMILAVPDLMIRATGDGQYLDIVGKDRLKILNADQFVANSSIYDSLPSDLAQRRVEQIQTVLTVGTVQVYDQQLTIEGSRVYEEVRIVPLSSDEVLIMVRDITQRKQAEQKLRNAEANYRSIFENAVEGIFQTTPDGRYLSVNPAHAAMLGYDSPASLLAEMGDLNQALYVDPDRRNQFIQLIQHHSVVQQFESQVYRRDGSIIWVSENVRAVYDDEGTLRYYEGTSTDITQRRLTEAKLREQARELEEMLNNLQQAQAQLIQTEKMSSLGQLVAGIAHEINNPVNFIYGNLVYAIDYTRDLLAVLNLYQRLCPSPGEEMTALRDEVDLDFVLDDLPKMLASMQVGAERIRQIVLTLRNYSRLDEAEMKTVNLHEGIDSTIIILQHRLKLRSGSVIELLRNYGEVPPVECYAGQLNQVFTNIISNAIDALGDWDATRSAADIADRPSQIRITTTLLNADWVSIIIQDNGPGMSAQVLSRLFDPFFTTKPVGKGTGLGLSISYQIVTERHGGRLRCISEPGQGAAFHIEIPIQQTVPSSQLPHTKMG